MSELTEYLIELGKMLGIDTDTEGCVNPNLALSARIVIAIRELEQPLQWKDVSDGLPEVSGTYAVKYSTSIPYFASYQVGDDKDPNQWNRITAYIPVPIPEYVKEQR